MANLIQIGVSGLLSSQTSLTVTGNNISNANIPSYTRQRVELSTRPEQFTGAGYVGAGSQVSGITRQVEQFILTQIRMDTASYSALNGYANNIGQLDSLLADELSALSPGIESLFASLQTGAEDPTSVPARQLVIADLQSLSQRFGTLYDRLEQQAGAINDQLITLTQQITALGEGIAELNRAITQSPGTGIGQQPNRLLDERDELIRQLSEIVAVRTTNEASGAISVFIGSGQGLVVGSIANAVEARPSVEDPTQVDIFFKGGSSNLKITGLLTGGEVGGLLDFRTETLNPAFNALGRIALAMAGELNAQQRRGLDLEGQFGRNLFTDINDPAVAAQRVIADSSNALPDNRVARVVIDDLNQLTTSDYTLLLTDPTSNGLLDYQMIRRSDNTVVASGEFPGAGLPLQISGIDGFTVDLQSGSFQAGDRFTLRPTRYAARDIEAVVQRPQELAYAAPLRTDTSLGNRGSGSISAGEVLSVYASNGALLPEFTAPGQLTQPILIRFTDATTYSIFDNSDPAAPALISAGNGFTPGQSNTVVFGSPPAYQVELKGQPQTGDEFTIGSNTNGVADNRNALALAGLRLSGALEGGSLNFEDAYGRLVEGIGSRTAQVKISRDSAESLMNQSQATRDSLSGVNLDEEAAKLIQFEQAYNAAAQVISIARQLFNALLAAF